MNKSFGSLFILDGISAIHVYGVQVISTPLYKQTIGAVWGRPLHSRGYEVGAKVATPTASKHVCNQNKGAILTWFQISTLVPCSYELQLVQKHSYIYIYKTRNKTKSLFIPRKDILFQCRKQHVFGKTNFTSVYISNAPSRKNYIMVRDIHIMYIYDIMYYCKSLQNHVIFHGKVNTLAVTIYTLSSIPYIDYDPNTLPAANIAPENWTSQKKSVVSQPPFLRGYVRFREARYHIQRTKLWHAEYLFAWPT